MLKLKLELVPQTAFNMNLRHTLKKSEWDKIRKTVYSKAGHKCEICGVTGQMSAHEIWNYKENLKKPKVVLDGLVCLCNNCHMCKHWGMAQILADEGKLDMSKLREHFKKVNNCTDHMMDTHISDCFATWRRRSQLEWTLDISNLQQYYMD